MNPKTPPTDNWHDELPAILKQDGLRKPTADAPEGYFTELPSHIMAQLDQQPHRPRPFWAQLWVRVLVPTLATACLLVAGYFGLQPSETATPPQPETSLMAAIDEQALELDDEILFDAYLAAEAQTLADATTPEQPSTDSNTPAEQPATTNQPALEDEIADYLLSELSTAELMDAYAL